VALGAFALVEWNVRRWAKQLDNDDEWTRADAAKGLGKCGPLASPVVPSLIRTLKSRKPLTKPYSGGSLTIRDRAPGEARQALIRVGAAAVPALRRALDGDDAMTRVNAAWALWAITKETGDALPVLLKAWRDRDLDSQDEYIRIDATSALGEMAREQPDLLFPIVRGALAEDPEMGYEATRVLTAMAQKDDRAVAELFKLLGSDGENLYRFAAFGLRELKSAGIPLLIDGLTSDDAVLRGRCAWTLGGMKSTYAAPAIPALRACAGDSNGDVSEWAGWALKQIENKTFDRYFD
jgi:HEAT repeat protein